MRFPHLLAAAITFSALAGAAAAEDLTFTLKNHSGTAMTELYASPHNVDNWEEDILGTDVLADGEKTDVTIADGRTQCNYDLKMVFKDGTSLTDTANLCEMASYTVTH